MNLGLGIIAGNAALTGAKEYELQERDRQRYEWERKRAEAEMGLLPDKTEADRSGYRLKSGQNNAGLELLPGDTQNKLARQGIDKTRIQAEAQRAPTEEATKSARATIDNATTANDLLTLPDKIQQQNNVQTIATALSNVDVEELPRTLAQKRLANEVSQADSDLMIGAKLSDLIDAGDQNSIVRLLNAQKRTVQDPKIASLPDAASVSKATDANGVEYLVIKDAQGNQIMAKPVEAFRSAKNALAKIEYKTVNAGDTLAKVQGGKVTPVYTAPESQKSLNANAGPLARDINYYMREFGLTKEQAEAKVNATKTMSREQFILKAVQENTFAGQDPDPKAVEKWGKFYDDVIGKGVIKQTPPAGAPAPAAAPAPAGSNSSTNPKIQASPAVRNLLGL